MRLIEKPAEWYRHLNPNSPIGSLTERVIRLQHPYVFPILGIYVCVMASFLGYFIVVTSYIHRWPSRTVVTSHISIGVAMFFTCVVGASTRNINERNQFSSSEKKPTDVPGLNDDSFGFILWLLLSFGMLFMAGGWMMVAMEHADYRDQYRHRRMLPGKAENVDKK